MDKRFFRVAKKIADRRVVGLVKAGDLRADYDESVTQYVGFEAVRVFECHEAVEFCFHKEAFRELRMKAGVSARTATWEWWQTMRKISIEEYESLC